MATLRTTPVAICIAVVVLTMSELVKSDRSSQRCTPRHCMWSDWASWSNCSTACGGSGLQFRHRAKLQTATCGGRRCEGDSQLKRSCNRFCYNGGTLQSDTCLCKRHHYGQCCEHHRLSKRETKIKTSAVIILYIGLFVMILISCFFCIYAGCKGVEGKPCFSCCYDDYF